MYKFLITATTLLASATLYYGAEQMEHTSYNYNPEYVYELEEITEEPLEEEVEMPIAFITTANLNLRTQPSTSSTRIMTVPRGTVIWVKDFLDYEWFSVTHSGMTGYMYATYLVEHNASATFTETSSVGTVELLYWSEAREILTVGTPATIIDVRTGITYRVASFSNGRHADVETLTAEDTAAMLRAFGGRWNWEPRPILVVVNGRTLAASINGMPHAGSTNHNNNMNGHVCIHFRGSRTHNGNSRHERDHQNAITEAFNTASRW